MYILGLISIMRWDVYLIISIIITIGNIIILLYPKVAYRKIYRNFFLHNWNYIDDKIDRFKTFCNIFCSPSWNSDIRYMYNVLCWFKAFIAFIDKKEETFFRELKQIKRPEEFGLYAFILSLYYLSKQDRNTAQEYYEKYLENECYDFNMKVIMDYLFDTDISSQLEAIYKETISRFQNRE